VHKLRRGFGYGYYSDKDSSIGCALLIVLVIFLPLISFILKHLILLLPILIIYAFIILIMVRSKLNEDKREIKKTNSK